MASNRRQTTKQNRRHNKVRNQLAHRWSEKEVFYKVREKKELPKAESIDKFKEDAEVIWKNLRGIYIQEQQKHIRKLISKLEDLNTIDA